jgi:hypothetical protein
MECAEILIFFNFGWLAGMSAPGRTEKNTVQAYVFRFALELGHSSMQSACLKGARHFGCAPRLIGGIVRHGSRAPPKFRLNKLWTRERAAH